VKRSSLTWTVVAVVAAAGGTTAVVLAEHGTAPPAQATAAATTATVKVVRTDLATTIPMFGQLGFSGEITVVGMTGGVYTWLPAPGTVIAPGQTLYEVDGRAVPLLAGDRPAWRALAPGMTPGPDVAALNSGLVALGHAHGIAGNPHFTAATGAAVRRWQRALGGPVTGRIDLGQVVFAPAPLRVREVPVRLGSPAGPGQPVLTATSTERVVQLQVQVDQAFRLHVGDAVTVTLPDAHSTTPGRVSAVSPVAQQQSDQDGRPGVSTVEVTVALADPNAAAAYTSAPVSVAVTTASVQGVLAVPLTALLARPGGQFAVTVVGGGQRREVAVTPGLFAGTMVQVTGDGLAEGDPVEVPAS
jgi:hypothetical protein